MPILVEQKESNFETAPAGNHLSVCYAIYDIGTHSFPDQKTGGFKMMRKVRICWELSNELMTDGRPFGVSALYTLSLDERANLYKMLIGWRGRAFTPEELKKFDLANLLSIPAMVSVIHSPDAKDSKKIWANVSTVGSLPKGMPRPTLVNPLVQFSIDDLEIPEGTPSFIAKKIEESEEWRHRKYQPQATGATTFVPSTDPDSTPF